MKHRTSSSRRRGERVWRAEAAQAPIVRDLALSQAKVWRSVARQP
jgi:hypothetical protein